MEYTHIKDFKVENFKKFTSLEVNNMGKVNLIVGDNNVGKTTLLEALVMNNSLKETVSYLLGCLGWRNIIYKKINSNFLETYFKDVKVKTIKYSFNEKNNSQNNFRLSVIETASLSKEQQDELNLKNLGKIPTPFSVTLENLDNQKKQIESLTSNMGPEYMPFINYNLTFGPDLIQLYSDIIKIDKNNKTEILEALVFLIPQLENIEISSESDLDSTFLIILKNQNTPLILNHFGDGTIKLFRYLLEIRKCENNRIMIDEIDTGIHYSKMKNFLKTLIRLSIKNNVQLFFTTHSKECIDSYAEALKETNNENVGRIIRLADTKSGIRAYTIQYNEFENALISESELR